MRSVAILIVIVAILASRAWSQPQLDLELHAVTQDATFANIYNPGPITVDPAGLAEFSIDLFVRAQLLGDPEANGLSFVDGRLNDDGTGSWAASPLTNTDVLPVPWGPEPDLTDGRRGLTPDYIGCCGCDLPPCCYNGCAFPSGWAFLPANFSPFGVPDPLAALDDLYRVEWTTTDLTPRTVHLILSSDGASYSAGSTTEFRFLSADQGQVDTDTFTIIFQGPICPCELHGASGIDVFDLLAYLDLWFVADTAADIDGVPGVDIFDLLHFLDCWFPASAGGSCP